MCWQHIAIVSKVLEDEGSHLNVRCMLILTNFGQLHINQQALIIELFNEDLAFTLLRSLQLSFHTLVVSLRTYIDQLFRELICGQLL
jgi:hypothetical protein